MRIPGFQTCTLDWVEPFSTNCSDSEHEDLSSEGQGVFHSGTVVPFCPWACSGLRGGSRDYFCLSSILKKQKKIATDMCHPHAPCAWSDWGYGPLYDTTDWALQSLHCPWSLSAVSWSPHGFFGENWRLLCDFKNRLTCLLRHFGCLKACPWVGFENTDMACITNITGQGKRISQHLVLERDSVTYCAPCSLHVDCLPQHIIGSNVLPVYIFSWNL